MEATGKYDFTATAEDELSFRKGDIIKILGTNDDWFKAEIGGMEGFVPRNYINIHFPRKSAEPPPISQERHNYRTPAPACPRPPEPSPPPQASAPQVRAMYDFTAEDADELNFHAGDIIEVLDQSDRFWWKGVLRGRTGLFPVNYTSPV
ncbi:hypothetical protein cypCar_00035963 [Cyprinus carpio]|nr:hypothetical protein cypCar_00035963 [Cyprinus carpio]